MDKLILQILEKHIEDLSHKSLQGIDIDSIDQLKYELTNLVSFHIVTQQRELLVDFAETYQNCHIDDTAENTVDWYLRTKDN